jgi:flagella basal body P-ring formation protein FlgA
MKQTACFLCIGWLFVASNVAAKEFIGELSELEALVKTWVSSELNLSEHGVALGKLNKNIRIQACEVSPSLSFPFNNQNTVQVACDDRWKLFVSIDVNTGDAFSSAKKTIRRGDTIDVSDIENPEQHWQGLVALRDISVGEHVTDEDFGSDIVAYRTTQMISAGQEIESRHLEKFIPATTDRFIKPITTVSHVRLVSKNDLEQGAVLTETNTAVLHPRVVATRALPHGTIIEDEDAEVSWSSDQHHVNTAPTDLIEVVGLQTTRRIRPQEMIRYADLTQALLVKKGMAVTLEIRRRQLTIQVETVALEDGEYGQQIRLKNLESGQTIYGIVTGKHAAQGIR